MLRHCTKCDRNVLPNPEGLCPSCGESTHLTGIDEKALEAKSRMRIAVISGHAKLPGICPFCGEPATTSSVLTWSRDSPHATDDEGLATMRAGLVGLILDRLLRQRDQVISFRLPRCGGCAGETLEVSSIKWDDYRLEAYCHRDFCEAMAVQTR